VGAVIETEELARVVLVGHSYGGLLITAVADRYPERIAHLVYLDAIVPPQWRELVPSVEELRLAVKALKAQEADAFFYTNDAMVSGQAQLIIDTAREKKLPTRFAEQGSVAQGALAGYGVNYYEGGRLAAAYVQRVLTGTSPQNLPVETLSRVELAVSLKTARAIGITIPQAVLLRADKVIE
jgi:putative ABC transport system substrate-binding protein